MGLVKKIIPVEKTNWDRIQDVIDGTTTGLILIDPVKEEVAINLKGKLLIIFFSGE
ncbi:hypothetical protein [Haliscomenobacter sp.]|uniref:hypothetical protein n=1 Tax=Haliscomenobacter sp. TaxID=2717303 RepID=UPI003BA98CEC